MNVLGVDWFYFIDVAMMNWPLATRLRTKASAYTFFGMLDCIIESSCCSCNIALVTWLNFSPFWQSLDSAVK